MSDAEAPAGSARPLRRRRPRHRAVVVTQVVVVAGLAFVVAALVVCVGSLGLTYDSVRKSATNGATFLPASVRPTPASWAASSAPNILLIGTDGTGVAPTAAEAQDDQADTVLLLHIPADSKRVYAVAIQQNTWVNTALGEGGLPTIVRVVESLTGVRVDHVAVVSCAEFPSLTTTLGGVTLENRVAFSRDGFDLDRGSITLTGAEARSYVRTGDTSTVTAAQQVANQQAYTGGVPERRRVRPPERAARNRIRCAAGERGDALRGVSERRGGRHPGRHRVRDW